MMYCTRDKLHFASTVKNEFIENKITCNDRTSILIIFCKRYSSYSLFIIIPTFIAILSDMIMENKC